MKKEKVKKHYFAKFISVVILLIVLLVVYARFIGTKGLIVKEYAVINTKLPESFNGLKVVHFSDLHYGSTITLEELDNIVNRINELKPDIVFFTGDLIDHNYKIGDEEKEKVINLLNSIDAKYNKYSVRGNHDVSDIYNSVITQTNFIELNNINKPFYLNDTTPIYLVGLDDSLEAEQNISQAFNFVVENESYYTIVLAHEPDTLNSIKSYDVDLMLSGHSHNGQVRIPFFGAIYTPEGAKSYYDEKYIIDETTLFISSGLGTSMYPLRAFNTPSVNLYRFYNK